MAHSPQRVETAGPGALVIVGLHSAGKTTLSHRLSQLLGGRRIVELGDLVRDEAQRNGSNSLLKTAESMMLLAPDEIAKRALESLSISEIGPIVVGPRTHAELAILRSELHASVVAVDTPDAVRRGRWRRRHLHISDTWEERERWEANWQTADLIRSADLMVSGHDWVGYAAARVIDQSESAH